MANHLTNDGEVDLLGSQLVARQCYKLSMREQIGEKSLESPPRGSNPRVAITVCRLDQGG